MHSCHACDKSFSRKDSLLRHQRQYCNVMIPRSRLLKRTEGKHKAAKSNNLIEFSSLDFIQILTAMFNEQRDRWRKDFKKLKNAILPEAENSDSSADEELDSTRDDDDDDDHNSDIDEAHSSSEWNNHTNRRHGYTK